jgi:cobalt-zinc-cadmium efflux system protein
VHQHSHTHPHVAIGRADGATAPALRIALITTAVLLLVQVAGGVLSKSLALLADAAHLLTDTFGLALAYTAARLAQRPATPQRTYGLFRVEILATLVNGVALLVVSGFLLYEAVDRLRHPHPLQPKIMLAFAAVSLVGNLVALSALRRTGSDNLNLRAAYLEVVADTLGTAGVLIAAVVILASGWIAVDPILSGLLALAIVPRTAHLVKEALHVLLESTPPGLDHALICAEIRGVAGVSDLHDLHVWSLTSGMPVLTAHVVTAAPLESCDDLLDRISQRLKEVFGIDHVTIQIEHADRARKEDFRF